MIVKFFKKAAIFLFAFSIFMCTKKSYALEEVILKLNGVEIKTEAPAEIKNSRTLVPLSVIGKAMGAEVYWENASQRIEVWRDNAVVTLFIGDTSMYFVSGEDTKITRLETAPYIKNSRTMVPVRAIAEIFGADVSWNNDERTVELRIEKEKPSAVDFNIKTPSENINSENPNEKPTLKFLLKNAMMPVGRVLYIYGGAWNKEDNGSGIEAKTFGLSNTWIAFFNSQDKDYDHKKHSYEIHNGLDCSGFISWVLYNTFRTEGKEDYLVVSGKMAKSYANRGWGSFTPSSEVKDHRAGDIMSKDGHVFLSLGTLSDGSVLLVHATPPGVKLSGTMTPDGRSESEAHKLAVEYMKKYRSQFSERYQLLPNTLDYLTEYDCFRWDLSPKGTLSDPDGIFEMTPEEILKLLFEE